VHDVEFDGAWSSPPDQPFLQNQAIHVWLVQLDSLRLDIAACEELLSVLEKKQASSFKFDRDHRRYVIAHAALRSILAAYLLVPPRALEFISGPRGKPKLAPVPGKDSVAFNLSHSHEVAMIAVTRRSEIGVDVEYVKDDFPFEEVARRFFSPAEVATLTRLPSELQRVAFFKCWTSKEAYLKAKGTGLYGKLDEVELLLTQEHAVRVNGAVAGWSLGEITISRSYVAAFVLQGSDYELSCYHWDPSAIAGEIDRTLNRSG
jgi:4'-phosphopantetheinyl transferase